MYIIVHKKTMRISELRKLVREVFREAVIDKDGLERVGVYLPQTKEVEPKNESDTNVGGLGLNAIAQKHGISVDMLVAEFKKGISVEMENTDDREVAKKIVLDNLLQNPKYYKGLSIKEAFTKGQLFAGKMKIGGKVVDVEVELLGADNKTKEFLTRVIHVDKQYQSKLPIGSKLPIPARIFRTPGGGWRKIKTPSVFEHSDCGCGCGGVTEGGCNIK